MQQEAGFDLVKWLLMDTPPCDGGVNVQICLEDCWTDNCPFYQQYLEEKVEA